MNGYDPGFPNQVDHTLIIFGTIQIIQFFSMVSPWSIWNHVWFRTWSSWNHKPLWFSLWSAWNQPFFIMAEYYQPVFVWEQTRDVWQQTSHFGTAKLMLIFLVDRISFKKKSIRIERTLHIPVALFLYPKASLLQGEVRIMKKVFEK